MSHKLSEFVARSATTLPEALSLLAEPADADRGPWRPLAGGTDLMVTLAEGTLPVGRYVDIWPLDELRGITVTDHAVEIGALTTYTDIRLHPLLPRYVGLFVCGRATEDCSQVAELAGVDGGVSEITLDHRVVICGDVVDDASLIEVTQLSAVEKVVA